MKFVRKAVIGMLFSVILVGGAFAAEFDPIQTEAPVFNSNASELNEVYSDSMLYFNIDALSSYLGGIPSTADFYVRYSALTDFTLQAVRFYVLGNPLNVGTVNVKAYNDNNGNPGTLIGTIFDGAPTVQNGSELEVVLAEEDQVDVAADTDFWIAISVPGYTNGWTIYVDSDGATPGDRSRFRYNGTWYDELTYDFGVTALGVYTGTFFDVKVLSLYNDAHQFHYESGSPVDFSARMCNTGVTNSPEASVAFEVTDAEDNVVFTNTVTLDPINAGAVDTVVVSASESWTPDTNGRYIASVTVTAAEDGSLENNVYRLLQDVQDFGGWMSYDDGTFEAQTGGYAGLGWATAFYPSSYPARIDSASFYFSEANPTAEVRVWVFSDEEWYEAWTWTGAATEGWNTFQIINDDNPQGVNTMSGPFLAILMETGDASISNDSNLPNSAANPDMPFVSFSGEVNGATMDWFLSTSGNHGIRAKVIEGIEPPRPSFTFPENIDFGQAVVGEESVVTLDIVNDGNLFGTVEQIVVSSSVSDMVRVISTIPFTVDAEATGQIEIGWTPTEEGALPTAGLLVYHNAVDEDTPSPKIVPMVGNASSAAVGEGAFDMPTAYSLDQNHPNPFNPTTEIRFGLPTAGQVRVTLYNVMGQEVAKLVNSQMNAGFHSLTVDGRNLSSGIYFYSLDVNGFHSMKKMVLMK